MSSQRVSGFGNREKDLLQVFTTGVSGDAQDRHLPCQAEAVSGIKMQIRLTDMLE